MKKLCLAAILSFLIGSVFSQKSEKDYTDAFKLIEVWLDAQKDYEKLPGITAIIVKDQDVLWSGAFGMANIEENVKAEASTLFSICSISKLFTSVAIMKLYDEGKLRLDDRIDDILPWYNLQQQYPESGPITIRSLLTHSSGLPRENTFTHWNGPDFIAPTSEQIKEELSELKTLYPASTYFQYSNLALTILGEVVEEVSKTPYEDYIIENILKPLGLSNTRPIMPKDLHGIELAIGYSVLNREGEMEKLNFFEAGGVNSAAGFSSNVIDLAKFASWQIRLKDTTVTEVLRPSTLKNMHNVHWTDPDWKTTWGLGFAVYKGDDGKKWVGHGGHCPGYKTTLRLNPKSKLAYSVMINTSGAIPSKYAKGMHAILSKVKAVKTDTTKTETKDLSEYSGFYDFSGMGEYYIATWEGKLAMLNLPTDNPAKAIELYKHIEGDKFRRVRDDGELGEELLFLRNKEGNIFQFRIENYLHTKLNR